MDSRHKFLLQPDDNRPFYRDLRSKADDRTVLTNPHKGWYIHYIDNGVVRESYRDDIPEGTFPDYLPGTKFLYLRFDWIDLEKEDGVFDWSYLDHIMDTFGAKGYKFMFRFCTYEGFEECLRSTPQFVFDKGAKFNVCKEHFIEPVYDDPIFMHYAERFIKACGEKLDGDPRVESVDIGTFGTFGEGHTYGGSEKIYSFETLKWHLDIHAKAFPHTRLVVNDDLLTHLYSYSKEQCLWLADYCISLGMSIRDDSINVPWFSQSMGYDTLRCGELFNRFKEHTPVDLEFEHYELNDARSRFCNGYRHIEALKGAGATYAGFHGHASVWNAEQRDLHEYLANRLGYWYFLDGYTLPPLLAGTRPILGLRVTNKGFSRAYDSFECRIVLEDKDGKRYTVCRQPAGNETWLSNQTATPAYTLDLTQIPAGNYRVLFGLFEEQTPVLFALSDELLTHDGYYTLETVAVE